uniref:Multiple epidermal growth factor-like domains protein 11 n=1 Tax=Crassostrea virginica TaxID=6565 RepID=A0A8B8AJL9_CRAVI|nr:multiple epidermal growth factor-like domains protein 11 [Crassostrea virginica]
MTLTLYKMSAFCGAIINVHLLICMYIPVSSYACSAGYSGPDCSIPCSYPNYGVGCQFKCVCGLKICSHILGCQKIIGSSTCSAGYFGPTCSLPCRYPNYGVKCQFKCVCDMENCSHITGCQNSNNSIETNTTFSPLEGKTWPGVINNTITDGPDCLSIGTNTSKSANQEAMKIAIWSMTFLTFVFLAIYFKLNRKKSLETANLKTTIFYVMKS